MKGSCEELYDEAMDYQRHREADWTGATFALIIGIFLFAVFLALGWIKT